MTDSEANGWDGFNASYNFAKVEDGDTQTFAFVGAPHIQLKKDGNKSILFNCFNVEKGVHEVLRCGVILAGKIKTATKGPAEQDKVLCVISRKGKGMDDTEYTVAVKPMPAEVKAAVAEIEPHDLTAIPVPEGRKKGRGKRK
jgi:hypothetical protein